MAYMSFDAEPAPTAFGGCTRTGGRSREGLTALEWMVVALAMRDEPSMLGRPCRISIAMGGVFGGSHDARLADPRLEALRRAAVLMWRQGAGIGREEVAAFEAAGFTPGQYRRLAASIRLAKSRTGSTAP